jgi:sporulation protein YlmC with PRC-barrel domain
VIGRGSVLLLAAVLSLGGAARADDAQAPAGVTDKPATVTPDVTADPPAAPSPVPAPDAPKPPVPAVPKDATPADPASAAPTAVPAPEPPKDVPPDAPKDPPKDVAQPPKNLEPIPKDIAITVLGKKVLGPDGEDMGRVTDLLLDRDAHIKSIVIDFGGFLGVGSRKIAIDWRLVRFVPDKPDAPIALSLGKSEVQAAPEYKDSAQPPVMVGPPPSGPDAAR